MEPTFKHSLAGLLDFARLQLPGNVNGQLRMLRAMFKYLTGVLAAESEGLSGGKPQALAVLMRFTKWCAGNKQKSEQNHQGNLHAGPNAARRQP